MEENVKENVSIEGLDEELVRQATKIEEDPAKILALVDLIFLGQEDKDIPS